ncbi:ABC transporter ATP-binding protein [Priestia koreensis]|uniref:ABC transporter ATP-binding protein n=1 Tax=Priestia koreensis TaxID=284581 RepID=UPI00345815AC
MIGERKLEEQKLKVRGVQKTFETIQAVQDVDLHVKKGEFVSIIGPSGCGKSTILDMIAGLTTPDSGEILLGEESVTGKRGHVAYMPQKDVLFPWRTVIENVMVPLEVAGVNKKKARKEAAEFLPIFGLSEFEDRFPGELSGGMRQRASFLRTYLCKKDLLLLDEPFGKLDALTRLQMQQWLLEIWGQFKQSVLLITHDIDEAILLSDRIYVLSPRPGKIIAEVNVDLPRPRASKITTSADFTAIKSRILDDLTEH